MLPRFLNRYGKVIAAGAAVIAGSFLTLGAVMPAKANSGKTKSENSLVGTWRVQIAPFHCDSGVKIPPFQSLLSFAAGGTLTESTFSPMFQPGQRSIGLGIWIEEGLNTYQAVTEAYIHFATPSNPSLPGLVRGTQRITQTIRVNGDAFSADAIVQFFDEAGNEVTKLCASTTAARLKSDS
jgi:hypothetical protein